MKNINVAILLYCFSSYSALAQVSISNLPPASAANPGDYTAVIQAAPTPTGFATRKMSLAQIEAFILGTLGSPVSVSNGGIGVSTLTTNAPILGNGISPVVQGTRSGNTTTFGTTIGTLTNGHCVSIDNNGNFIDAGGACTIGGGGGTVNAGTSGQLAYYATSTNAVSGNSLTALIDASIGSTRGSIIERGSTTWNTVLPGASGLPWVSNGAGTDPSYTALTGSGIANATVANSNLANMAAATVKGSVSGGAPADLTVAQLQGFARGVLISVTDPAYGAKCDGVTNDATAFNAAIAAANALTPGGRVIVPPGVCIVGAAIGGSASAVLSNIDLVGAGMGATTIKLANTSNVNVIDGDSSLIGSASNSGVSFFRLSDMTIDGNKANNTSGSCIAIYGWRINLINLRLQNCANHGLHTEYTGNALDRVNNYLNILIDTVGNHGWWNNGPGDSNADTIIVVDAGQASNNTWDGILLDVNDGQIRGRSLHPYHRATATNRMKFAIEDNAGGSNISDSNFEGANIPAQINSQQNTYINNSFYAAWNGAGTLIIKGPENTIVGFLGDPGAGRPATKGLILGTGADNAAVNMIDIVTSAQHLGAIDFTNSAGNNHIRVKGFATTGPGYVGVPASNDNVEVTITGTPTSLPHLIQKPSKQSTSGPTPVLTGCGATPGPTIVGTDHAGIIGTGGGATGCVLTFANSYVNPPFCVVSSQHSTSANDPTYFRSGAALTLFVAVASEFYHYICVGQPGG